MNINCKAKKGTCTIKTRTAAIQLDNEIKVNDLVLPGAGEYEIADSFLEVGQGFVHIHADEVTVAYFDETRNEVTEKELEMLENVDAVLFKVIGADKEKLEKINKMIKLIDPRVVVLAGLESTEEFKGVEGQTPEEVETLKLTQSMLPDEDRLVYSIPAK